MVSRISTPAGIVAVTPVTRLPPINVGDVIAVRVARHLTDSVMRLVAGSHQFDVEGQTMLPVGARARLHVAQGPDGPRYHVEPETPAPTTAASREAAALQRISDLATRLATDQDGLAPLYAGATATLAGFPASLAASLLPPAVQAAIVALFGLRLRGDGALDGPKLQQALLRAAAPAGVVPAEGGGSLEGALATLRALLRDLAGGRPPVPRQAAPPAPPGLSRHPRGQAGLAASPELAAALSRGEAGEIAALLLGKVEAALARGRLAALASRGLLADAEGAPETALFDRVLELPLAIGRETGVLSLQIGRDDTEGHEGEGAHPAWRVRFGLDLAWTGAVEAAVGLDGPRLFATVWAEREATCQALQGRLDALRADLSAQGLQVMELRVLFGLPGDPPAPSGQYVDRVS
ncbi:flagellar hook-length control protein FliK [Stappia taiwanensis]|uniref:Flagellar hook-length control protein FliK n=1 Tax=Stappia taiwanensis TaxID=992267 RepID=A0A838XJJ5_9HYPH|nr:flagellar hook-length control protein FliK [Stappia taiwanensis]MBA4610705.1 flagellar hook-length control protein FliK [Stappia taiwanensis]GGE82765.1 hypothetical protein GCM10007285_07930 [Stappia taiwanensis]